MEKSKVLILAGMLSRSNMGMGLPPLDTVEYAIANPPTSANAAAIMFCEQFMEEDSHEALFTGEAEMWVEELTKQPEHTAYVYWTNAFDLYAAADPKVVRHKFDGELMIVTYPSPIEGDKGPINRLWFRDQQVFKKSELNAVPVDALAQLVTHFVMPMDDVVHHLGLELK